MRLNDEDGSWTILTAGDELFMELSSADAFQTEFLAYNEKEQSVYLLDNRFSNMNQLVIKSLVDSNSEKVLGAQSHSDVDDVLFMDGVPKAYASYYEQKKWHVIDPSVQKDIAFLESEIGPNFEVISSSRGGDLWVVSCNPPDKGKQIWIYNREKQGTLRVFTQPKVIFRECTRWSSPQGMGRRSFVITPFLRSLTEVDMWINRFLS